MRLLEWLWSLLPDKCQIPGCSRKGIRGNENVEYRNGKRVVVCDYCSRPPVGKLPR